VRLTTTGGSAGSGAFETLPTVRKALAAVLSTETREKTELTIDIYIDLWKAHFPLGDGARMGDPLQASEARPRTQRRVEYDRRRWQARAPDDVQ